jgi:hypothetical protein
MDVVAHRIAPAAERRPQLGNAGVPQQPAEADAQRARERGLDAAGVRARMRAAVGARAPGQLMTSSRRAAAQPKDS